MADLLQFTSWLTQRESLEGKAATITNMKAQKLGYLAESLFGYLGAGTLVTDRFEAWEHGPVSGTLYRNIKGRLGADTRQPLAPFEAGDSVPSELEEIYEGVWENFGHLTAAQLRDLTHKVGPYRDLYKPHQRHIEIPAADIHLAWPDFIDAVHKSELTWEEKSRIDRIKALSGSYRPLHRDDFQDDLVRQICSAR